MCQWSGTEVSEAQPTELSAGGITLDERQHSVRCKGKLLQLTPKEFALLECLLRNQGRMMTRDTLFLRLYGEHSAASNKVVEVLMSTLRSKLVPAGADDLIETRRGFGYIIPQ